MLFYQSHFCVNSLLVRLHCKSSHGWTHIHFVWRSNIAILSHLFRSVMSLFSSNYEGNLFPDVCFFVVKTLWLYKCIEKLLQIFDLLNLGLILLTCFNYLHIHSLANVYRSWENWEKSCSSHFIRSATMSIRIICSVCT